MIANHPDAARLALALAVGLAILAACSWDRQEQERAYLAGWAHGYQRGYAQGHWDGWVLSWWED